MQSNVSDCLELMARVYEDATIKCSVDVSDFRDLMTIRSRVEGEGLSFLTITLPAFAKSFEQALDIGFISPTSFPGFHRVKGGAIPAFLQGMLERLFDRETGRLLNEDSPCGDVSSDVSTLVESVRQICLTFKKVELPCTPEREQGALENFKEVEREFNEFHVPESVGHFCDVADMLWGTILADFSVGKCIPRHGPGATAERVSGNQKYAWQYWFDRLEPYFPLVGSAFPLGIAAYTEELEHVTIVPEDKEFPVRVVLVPKTLKTPRVIAIEPCCMQFAQQGIRDFLYERIENSELTGGSVNFSDQSVNQKLALRCSRDKSMATIDLSDASDRVPLEMIIRMLRSCPELLDAVLACRSTSAQLPSGEIISPLQKFASMGSALCFPIEAMYFYTICVVALLDAYNLPRTFSSLKQIRESIYVYGDDIIVPVDAADVVLAYLQKYNCKVNTAKTFLRGYFRESCGTDAYCGYEVTPTYLRRLRPKDKRQASEIASSVATRNLFYKRGFWRTASLIQKWVEETVGTLPYVDDESEGLGWFSYLGYRSVERWNTKLHRFEVKTMVPSSVSRTDEIEGYPALMKFFLSNVERHDERETSDLHQRLEFLQPSEGRSYERSVVRGKLALKRRWVWSRDQLMG